MKHRLTLLTIISLLAITNSVYAGISISEVIDLGFIQGSESDARGINDQGQVVGSTDYPYLGHYSPAAYMWDNGAMSYILKNENYSESFASAINNNGDIVGRVANASLGYRAFMKTSDGSFSLLGTIGNSYSLARDINDNLQVVGYSFGSKPDRAFLYTNNTMVDILSSSFPNGMSQSYALNNLGQVVGVFDTGENTHAFLWDSSNGVHDLGTVAGSQSSAAHDINNNGVVVGLSTDTSHAFKWDAVNGIQDLYNANGGEFLFASAINDKGQIVGAGRFNGEYGAALWDNGTLYNLNDLLPTELKWTTLYDAMDINNAGQIVGYGFNADGLHRGYRITVTPEPISCVLFPIGGLGLMMVKKMRRKQTL